MAEIASESESYLSKNESDPDLVSVSFLLVQQCHINKKMQKDFQRKYLMEERRKLDETGQDVS